jgi:hypothetical protein
MPFNHKYFDIDVANDQVSAIQLAVWFSNAWHDVVTIYDRTNDIDKTFAQSGIIEWTPDREIGWDREQDSEDITDVSTVGIYNMYWLRFSFTGDLKASTAIKYIGYKFSSDTILHDYYPDTARAAMMSAFESGKTNWNEQHFAAAESIIRDLRRNKVIMSANQILNHQLLQEAATHKCAELIYWGLGRAYETKRRTAEKYFKAAMNIDFFDVDRNRDATLNDAEKRYSINFGRR